MHFTQNPNPISPPQIDKWYLMRSESFAQFPHKIPIKSPTYWLGKCIQLENINSILSAFCVAYASMNKNHYSIRRALCRFAKWLFIRVYHGWWFLALWQTLANSAGCVHWRAHTIRSIFQLFRSIKRPSCQHIFQNLNTKQKAKHHRRCRHCRLKRIFCFLLFSFSVHSPSSTSFYASSQIKWRENKNESVSIFNFSN